MINTTISLKDIISSYNEYKESLEYEGQYNLEFEEQYEEKLDYYEM